MLGPRSLAVIALVALGGCASHPAAPDHMRVAAASIDWAAAESVTVKLTDFDFMPSTVKFDAGQPVRLMLVNEGSGRHDFAAPAFFATVALRDGSAAPAGGKVSVAQGQSAEIDLVPDAPGQYPLTCTEFLHEMLGMTGTIAVATGSH